MEEKFDPYHQWLGIPADEQPPDHYRLLGIPLLESSAAVIENAANQRMGHLRTFQTGKHSADSQRLLNEVAAARVCLLRPEKKAAYDQELRKRFAPKATPVVAEAEPEAIDPELAAIFRTPPASGAAAISKRSNKKPPSLSPPSIAAIVAAASGMVLLGLWIAFSQSDKPDRNQTPAGVASSATGSAVGPRTSAGSEPTTSNPRPSTSTASAAALVAANPAKQSAGAGSRTSGTQPFHTKTENAAGVRPANSATPPRGTAAPAVAESAPKTELPVAAEPASGSSPDGHAPPGKEKTAAKRAPPSAEQQKKLIAEIDDIYKLKEAKDPAARVALARKLFDDGKKQNGNADEQFVLLRRASELAGDAGDTDLLMEVVDAMAATGFDIPPLRVKTLLLKRVLEQTLRDGEHISAACEACMRLAEEDAAHDGADEALDVLEAARKAFVESVRRAQTAYISARAAVTRTRDATEKAARAKAAAEAQSDLDAAKAAQSAIAQCVKKIQETVRQQQAVQAAQEKLKTAPDDPGACLTVGRWRCFHEGNWDEGLKLLAKGSDQTLKTLAADDLAAKTPTADQRVVRGDAWWDAAEKIKGNDKLAMRCRAEHWYSQALPDLDGLAKAKVEKRLELLAKEASSAPAAKVAAAARNWVLAKTKSVGGKRRKEFEESKPDAILIGLTVTIGDYNSGHIVIGSVQGIYRSERGQETGGRHGQPHGSPVTLLAKPGYAIGGIRALGGDCVDGFRIVFMRVKEHQLDPATEYESDWVGGKESADLTRLGCDGNPVVGMFGRKFVNIVALGLIQLAPGKGSDGPTAAQ